MVCSQANHNQRADNLTCALRTNARSNLAAKSLPSISAVTANLGLSYSTAIEAARNLVLVGSKGSL